jgi:hypothetical protein
MKKSKVYTTYEFKNTEQRLLGKVIRPHKGYGLEVGMLLMLGPTIPPYHHSKNVYAYNLENGKFRGRYDIEWFEVVGVFESEEALMASMKKTQGEEKEPQQTPYVEQLSLF